jgi:SET domain-containing protein
MGFIPSAAIEVKRVTGKGRGVFARKAIRRGEIIERVPVIVLPLRDVMRDPDDWTGLGCYCFEWGRETVALALGFGSLYNHSFEPNARYDDEARQAKVFSAIRDIDAGEEITINYNGDPDDRSPVWFDVREAPARRKPGGANESVAPRRTLPDSTDCPDRPPRPGTCP